MIVRRDRHLDYYVVRLDAPATLLDHGEPEELDEIVEDIDNLEIIE